MPQQNELHIFLGKLLAKARLKKGFKTIKEIYQFYKPTVDYQTWSSAESGDEFLIQIAYWKWPKY